MHMSVLNPMLLSASYQLTSMPSSYLAVSFLPLIRGYCNYGSRPGLLRSRLMAS
jgi:hypothetical protein